MFSNRFDWQTPPNALSLLLAKKKTEGRRIYDLTESNPTRCGFGYETERILAALSQRDVMRYEPDARGLAGAREVIAAYYGAFGGDAPLPDRIFLTASTSEAYGLLFKLLGDPGDEVLIPRPGYPLLSFLTRFEGLRPVAYPLRYDDTCGWRLDMEVLSALVTPATRAVVLVNPNNPTGSYIRAEELSDLDDICSRNGLALIVDEVFADYAAAEAPAHRVPTAAGRTGCLCFVLNGFSKTVALPQLKLGWIAVSGRTDAVDAAGPRLEALLDFYLPVSAPVQHAAAELLGMRHAVQHQIQSRITDNETMLRELAPHIPDCRVLRRDGGWYAIVDITDDLTDEERALRLLDQADTLIHPGYFYDFSRDGFMVLSLLPAPDIFRPGVRSFMRP